MIKLEGRGFKTHPGQSFPLSLYGPISICRANTLMVHGLKHQHFTSHSITTENFVNFPDIFCIFNEVKRCNFVFCEFLEDV